MWKNCLPDRNICWRIQSIWYVGEIIILEIPANLRKKSQLNIQCWKTKIIGKYKINNLTRLDFCLRKKSYSSRLWMEQNHWVDCGQGTCHGHNVRHYLKKQPKLHKSEFLMWISLNKAQKYYKKLVMVNTASIKKIEKYAYNRWRLGRPEKFEGMGPLRRLFDKSLHKMRWWEQIIKKISKFTTAIFVKQHKKSHW